MILSDNDWYEYHRADLINGSFMKYSVGNYAERNNRLVEMLEGLHFRSVVEVAGADGDLAARLLKKYGSIEKYSWSDMVREAIDNANERINSPRFKAIQLDLDYEAPPSADLFISTALEHTLNYKEIIAELPLGTLVLLSLPNFDGIGHRVHFTQFTDVLEIYGNILRFLKVEVFINEKGIKNTFITLIKKCLKHMGLLSWFIKIGIFKSGCGREFNYYKWLILARRNDDPPDACKPDSQSSS